MTPELIADYGCICGEGPVWHPTEQRLYWVDIVPGRIYRYDPASGVHEMCLDDGRAIGGLTIQADGGLALFMADGAVGTWCDGKLTTLIEDIPAERGGRFNDVIADPRGRVFCGTMPVDDRPGRLYRLDTDGTLTQLLDGVTCSNGMGFTPDGAAMYYTDSFKHEIYLFDYDVETGGISNRRIFASPAKDDGIPDGLTVDAEGGIWSARWDGSCAVRYNPDGSEDQQIALPVPKVSSVTFGGRDYREMYITTAGGDQKDTDGQAAGGLFRARPDIGGVPEFLSRIGL